jgi:hypothetical protein
LDFENDFLFRGLNKTLTHTILTIENFLEVSGRRWPCIPLIQDNGWMEIGRAFDFHMVKNNGFSDDFRIQLDSNPFRLHFNQRFLPGSARVTVLTLGLERTTFFTQHLVVNERMTVKTLEVENLEIQTLTTNDLQFKGSIKIPFDDGGLNLLSQNDFFSFQRTGRSWPAIVAIQTHGEVKVGRYLDFHIRSDNQYDYNWGMSLSAEPSRFAFR